MIISRGSGPTGPAEHRQHCLRIMISKRARGYVSEELPPDKRLRANLVDVFTSNEMSATRARSIMHDSHDSGARGVENLQRLGSDQNVTRNVQRRLLKKSPWPKEYVVEITTWNKRRKTASRGGHPSASAPRDCWHAAQQVEQGSAVVQAVHGSCDLGRADHICCTFGPC